MILTPFIAVLYVILFSLASPFFLIDDVSFSSQFYDAIATGRNWIYAINDFLPVFEMIGILLGVFFVYEIAFFGWKFVNWIIRKIPGVS